MYLVYLSSGPFIYNVESPESIKATNLASFVKYPDISPSQHKSMYTECSLLPTPKLHTKPIEKNKTKTKEEPN